MQLAERLSVMRLDQPIIYALPRGGVPVAVEVAHILNAPLDLILVRKIGAPANPEVALGAIVEGTEPQIIINEDVKRWSGADSKYIERVRAEQMTELERRRAKYLGKRPRLNSTGRTVVVVDDGLATGATLKAALAALKRSAAARIVVALPVAPKQALEELAAQADDIVCLHPATEFRGVGGFYRDFHQLSDEETVASLRQLWTAQESQTPSRLPDRLHASSPDVAVLRAAAEPLAAIDDPEFAAAFDRFGSHRVVLLGEASHGTSEFYHARAAITRRLIEEHGFSIVAVEADWPDAAVIDRHIRDSPHHREETPPFTRFPTWMWRNVEFQAFTDFLRDHNKRNTSKEQIRFYGLDLYNMNAAIAEVLAYLDRVDRAAAEVARERYSCLLPWADQPAAYGSAALKCGFSICEEPINKVLVDLFKRKLDYIPHNGGHFFDATQNARLVANAERFYRAMYYETHESWNLRDQHMFHTLKQILDHAGPDKKAVVWAHNSHIGDARFTDMGRTRKELNIGQLCREEFGDKAALIGFGTASGTVAAASEWDAPVEIMTVRPPRPDSYEALLHDVDKDHFLVDFCKTGNEALRRVLAQPRLQRYIGVIYRPESERASHYDLSNLSDQYDAFVWFDKTNAVTPLPTLIAKGEDETYPFGL